MNIGVPHEMKFDDKNHSIKYIQKVRFKEMIY